MIAMRYLVKSQAGPVLFFLSDLETFQIISEIINEMFCNIYEVLQIILFKSEGRPLSRKIGKAQRRFASLRTNRVKPVVIAQRQHLFRYLV